MVTSFPSPPPYFPPLSPSFDAIVALASLVTPVKPFTLVLEGRGGVKKVFFDPKEFSLGNVLIWLLEEVGLGGRVKKN